MTMPDQCQRIDPIMRRKYARLLRGLATERLTNYDYEDAVDRVIGPREDKAITAIYKMAWYLYDDLHEHRLLGKYALTREGRREVAKWLLFLYSDREFTDTSLKKNPNAWPFANKQELADQVKGRVKFSGGEESLPEGLAPYQTSKLEQGKVERRFSSLNDQAIIGSILVGILWIVWKWHGMGYSRKALPLLLYIVISVVVVLALPITYMQLKWWHYPIVFAALIAWLCLAVFICSYAWFY